MIIGGEHEFKIIHLPKFAIGLFFLVVTIIGATGASLEIRQAFIDSAPYNPWTVMAGLLNMAGVLLFGSMFTKSIVYRYLGKI